MLRTCFGILAFIFYFVVTLPILLILLIIRCFNPKLAAKIAQPIVCGFGFRLVLLFTGIRWKAIGKENIPKDTPVLFTANHRSFFDIPLAYVSIPVTYLTGFVAKKEIKKVPFLNWWMMLLNCVFLDRSSPKAGLKSIQEAIDHVKNGWSIFIMPSGTRNKGEGVDEFKAASFKIAEKTGCPVVPVAIVHTDEVFEQHFPRVEKHTITMKFGKPIETAGLSRAEFKEIPGKAYEEVCKMYNEIY
jgi:1-acyl-sn-glycerol-3-phosphate acyltransferase